MSNGQPHPQPLPPPHTRYPYCRRPLPMEFRDYEDDYDGYNYDYDEQPIALPQSSEPSSSVPSSRSPSPTPHSYLSSPPLPSLQTHTPTPHDENAESSPYHSDLTAFPPNFMAEGYFDAFFSGRANGSMFLCQHVLDDSPLGRFAVKKIAVGQNRSRSIPYVFLTNFKRGRANGEGGGRMFARYWLALFPHFSHSFKLTCMSEITSQIWNLADDTDSHFTYNGDWELMFGNTIFDEFTGTLNGLSTDGDVFNNSVHSTKTNGTSFTFRFNGTSNFDIYASLTTTELDGSVGPDPGRADVSCVLDGEVVAINGISLSTVSSISNQKVCSGRAEPSNKEHEIGFKIRNLNRTRFSFDYIAYEPIPDAIDESNGETLLVSPDALSSSKDPGPGPQLSFDSKWKGTPNGDEAFTQSPGSLVTARFNGTAIQFYSELSGNSSSKPNSATYQLDDNSPVSFELKNPDPFNSEVCVKQAWYGLYTTKRSGNYATYLGIRVSLLGLLEAC
ncbi:hypothetical protein D9758_015546 [Tetrapyrgos nigripes]|uniref:Uncharacterized protein n=1 Tax=Tetrapyrgos nigripes TaxID=182062 RepID=A0A8H5C469_9AGAR|nr:hypothetical protein D9758_015546 [Tetrapyrgos nigripes]